MNRLASRAAFLQQGPEVAQEFLVEAKFNLPISRDLSWGAIL
jgi:hypothetical protein